MLQFSLETLLTTRENLFKATQDLTLEQINTVKKGFNNTIGWNFIHAIVTQQILCYQLTNNTPVIPQEFIENFKKGSGGTHTITQQQWQQIRAQSITSIRQLDNDYNSGKLTGFTKYKTSYGVDLHSIEEAITFNCMHEALHLGYIMAMKKSL